MIGDFVKKKKDPASWLEQRLHELLREMENFLDVIRPQITAELSRIKSEGDAADKRVRAVEDSVTTALDQADKLKDAADSLVADYETRLQGRLDDHQAEIARAVRAASAVIAEKVKEVNLLRGPKGEQGKQGERGPKGEQGSPDTPTQIAEKLNTTEETVSISVIKGLSRELEKLRKAIETLSKTKKGSGGGGGMGNVQHESFSTSSATASVQVSTPIAGNGYAIWAYYNGQLIMRGVHYTVSTDRRTLAFNFTLEDNTNVDIIYIR